MDMKTQRFFVITKISQQLIHRFSDLRIGWLFRHREIARDGDQQLEQFVTNTWIQIRIIFKGFDAYACNIRPPAIAGDMGMGFDTLLEIGICMKQLPGHREDQQCRRIVIEPNSVAMRPLIVM
jgi:hypothetical protein